MDVALEDDRSENDDEEFAAETKEEEERRKRKEERERLEGKSNGKTVIGNGKASGVEGKLNEITNRKVNGKA